MEWKGDEIAMGAVFLDADGEESIHSEFRVMDDFRNGDVKNYPPKILKNFGISASAVYPQTYSVFVALAEKDNGGLSDFIQELYEAVRADLQKILTALGALAGAAIGAQIGGSVGTAVGGPLGTIIGVAAGAILGAIAGWLTDVLKDDIFEPQMASITLPDGSSTFANGSLTSPYYYLDFIDHGGEYKVKYRWKLNR